MDLIHGLQSDGHATEYLCQEFRPYGLLSTKASVIMKAKQKVLWQYNASFNRFECDGEERNLLDKTKPDYIEVLPGAMTDIIAEVKERTGVPILAGGFIRTVEDVERALNAGATAITTSKRELWKHYQKSDENVNFSLTPLSFTVNIIDKLINVTEKSRDPHFIVSI